MTTRPRGLEWWISIVRLLAVPFAALQVATTSGYPGTTQEVLAWMFVAALAAGGVALFALVHDDEDRRFVAVAMAFDFVIISAFTLLYAFEIGTPTRQLLLVIPILGAIRFGMTGGIALALAITPVAGGFEELRSGHYLHVPYRVDFVTFELGLALIIALLVGWLVNRLNVERVHAEQRAGEAEALRDELGRRADLLDAANRCARALSSSLDLDEAFGAFIRELRGLVPFDRMAIVLAEGEGGRVIATAGEEADRVMAPGTTMGLEDNLLAEIVARGQIAYRADMTKPEFVEERWLSELGLLSRVAAPLLVGARTIGLISVVRRQVDAFTEHEIELVGLLGRLVASAVQNIRAYEGERRTVEELRRLSALRADFVSLVSHELRSPMAAVIGAARTLQTRWRELQPDQREAFLALIGDETNRLAALIGDVLDTSRIDAGTFTYRFTDVDVGTLVEESVATAALGQDEVPIVTDVAPQLPHVRGDAARLRQIVSNLIDNAVKYSPVGEPVQVGVAQRNGAVVVTVTDRGPGIRAEDQRLIFEKFGRVADGGSKPGTGLGLFIARSIAEAHGGELRVSSAPGRGSTFSVTLPI
jgi:signal transduction histidine kinase